jgi:hypothetical protein
MVVWNEDGFVASSTGDDEADGKNLYCVARRGDHVSRGGLSLRAKCGGAISATAALSRYFTELGSGVIEPNSVKYLLKAVVAE